jgi:ATP-binding protein involved in chromosome partitioning
MDQELLKRSVMTALSRVLHPHTGDDIVSGGHVQNLETDDEGAVRFSVLLRPEDPGSIVREARTVASEVEGVAKVKVNVQLPQAGGPPGTTPTAGPGTAPPTAAGKGGGLKPGSVPAPTPQPGLLRQVDHVVAVSSGKGGVGKSMVATNVAAALAREGLRVGLLDADIYGPNIPRMFGETRRPRVVGEKGKELIEPLEAHGVRLMSLGFLLEEEQPAIMRGPLIAGILKQFLEQVDWGPLDVMVVDMPPGTGDAQLSLVQTIDVDGAVMVSTPQAVSTGDVRRGVKMFQRVNTPVLGVVENMSGEIFGEGGAEQLSRDMGLDFLGRVPLDVAVRRAGDAGVPTVIGEPESPAGVALAGVAAKVFQALRNAGAEPAMPVVASGPELAKMRGEAKGGSE